MHESVFDNYFGTIKKNIERLKLNWTVEHEETGAAPGRPATHILVVNGQRIHESEVAGFLRCLQIF